MQNQLDVASDESIETFAKFMETKGGFDVLVNNAAVYLTGASALETTMEINYFGTVKFTMRLLPLLRNRPHVGRIINVSSNMGRLSQISVGRQRQFTSKTLSVEELNLMMQDYMVHMKAVRSGTISGNEGWSQSAYGMSKLALNALTKVLARDEPSIAVNCMDPGYCQTDMNRMAGTRTAEGADTVAYLALLDALKVESGLYYVDRNPAIW